MNKAKWIKKIIGEAVTEKGFSYTGCTGGSDVGYSFKRRVDGEDEDDEIMQIIEIFISLSVIGGYDIRLTFCTNAYGVINQEVTNLIQALRRGTWMISYILKMRRS